MKTTPTMTLRIRFRWWFKLWLYATVTIEHFTGWAPKPASLKWWVDRGTRFEVQS